MQKEGRLRGTNGTIRARDRRKKAGVGVKESSAQQSKRVVGAGRAGTYVRCNKGAKEAGAGNWSDPERRDVSVCGVLNKRETAFRG